MKKTSILIYISILFCLSVNGQISDLRKLAIHGDVKSNHESSFTPVEMDGKIQNGAIEYSFFNRFNVSGNKIEDIKYTPEGKPDKKYEYIYDGFGRRIEQDQSGTDGKLTRKIIYKYDEIGNLTEDNSYNPEGKLEKKYTYKYDNQGNVIEDKSFDADNTLLKRFTYTFDATGNKIENKRYSAHDILEKTISYHYDISGNLTEEITVLPDQTQSEFTYVYEFDNQHNWVRKIKFQDKKPVNILVRELEYY